MRSKMIGQRRDRGVAAIFVTMIIMVVVSLIVLGFATVSRREYRQTLDRQLSSQAYYAAESGVNDALAAIKNGYLTANPNGKTSCTSTVNPLLPTSNNETSIGNTSTNSCLLIYPYPGHLSYSNIDLNHSTVVPITVLNSLHAPITPGSLTFTWQANDNFPSDNWSGCAAAGNVTLPPVSSWNISTCDTGVIRLDIMPGSVFGAVGTRANMIAQTKTYYLLPQKSGGWGSVDFSTVPTGFIIPVTCASGAVAPSLACSIQIVNLNNPPTATLASYYLQMRSLYTTNQLNILPATTTDSFKDAQAVIDSTGESTTVLRRIEVYAPLTSLGGNGPQFAIESTGTICKAFTLENNAGAPTFRIPSGVSGNTDTSTCNF